MVFRKHHFSRILCFQHANGLSVISTQEGVLGSKGMSLLRFGNLGKDCWAMCSRGWHGTWQQPWYTEFPLGFAFLAAPENIWMAKLPEISIMISCLLPSFFSFMKGFIKVPWQTFLWPYWDVICWMWEKNSKKRYSFMSKFFDSLQSLTVSSPRWDKLQRRCYPSMNLEELCLGWIGKHCLYKQGAQNRQCPKLGQRLWYTFEFSALLTLKTSTCFLRLG